MVNGVAMGQSLGPTFANFYMGHMENEILDSIPNNTVNIYTRYVDDIFLQVTNESDIVQIKNLFEEHTVLKFTYELNIRNRLPFLDVLIDNSNQSFKTSVYYKPTNTGQCLNANSHCIQRYKNSVINSYLNRAYKVSTTWEDFHSEITHIKQNLINNNYSNSVVDSHISKFLHKKQNDSDTITKPPTIIPLYYKNQYHSNYKTDERVLK